MSEQCTSALGVELVIVSNVWLQNWVVMCTLPIIIHYPMLAAKPSLVSHASFVLLTVCGLSINHTKPFLRMLLPSAVHLEERLTASQSVS